MIGVTRHDELCGNEPGMFTVARRSVRVEVAEQAGARPRSTRAAALSVMMGGCRRDHGSFPSLAPPIFVIWGGIPRPTAVRLGGEALCSDTLHELTQDDLIVLRDLGSASIVDLRTAAELDRTGRGLLGAEPVDYLHLSVIDEDGGESRGIPAPADDDLAHRDPWYLEIGRERVPVQALTMVGYVFEPPARFPLRGRKGLHRGPGSAVLDIVGVEREVIVEDYVLDRQPHGADPDVPFAERWRRPTCRGAARGSAGGRSSDDGRISFGARPALRWGAPMGAGGRSEPRVPRGDGGCSSAPPDSAHRVTCAEEPRTVPASLASGRRGQGYLHQHGQDGEHPDTPRDR